ncbi:beta-lactamase family protein [Luteibacter aegosomaticola]|uniref:serine hydrolase domain-containing protein n=1 Tax=Luteibacter aegosomaticola TaxID=2911538 RepID=UPI001FF9EFF5|nr:serine hydrolase domain-containing protein [Luteibacter aegosomaticola]UPG91488.1 beta-lactamase family protein [Luteibacter aegosomaticola]
MKRHRFALATVALCASVSTASLATDQLQSDNPLRTGMNKAVDRAATAYFANACHAGVSVAVVTPEGERVYDYGVANRKTGAPTKADSVYEIASVTKSFTATLAAFAVHEGKMTLDGDFRRYLDGPYPNLAIDGHPITLGTLLTHRSGMPRDIPKSDAIFAEKDPRTLPGKLLALNQGRGEKDFLRDLHHTTLQSKPGDEERYSNAGFMLIGVGLERVYHAPYATLLDQRILSPLGMASTTLRLSPALAAKRVTGYDMFGKPAPAHPDNAGAAWGLWSTAADLARFVRWQLDESNPAIALSHRPLVHGSDEDVAMAWHVAKVNDAPMISHGGGSFGTSSQVVLFPHAKRGYALLANDTCKGTEGALKRLAMDVEQANDSP